MIGIVFSTLDVASSNIANSMLSSHSFEEAETGVFTSSENRRLRLHRIETPLLEAEVIDSFGLDAACVLSKHRSAAGVGAMTVHATGNWTHETTLGGNPKQLSYSAPVEMLSALSALSKIPVSLEKVYEATHHGPLLKTPSFFVELGGNDNTVSNKEIAAKMADAVFESAVEGTGNLQKVVLGIGGTHYPEKFSALAVQKGYAFAHIMPKYAIKNQDGSYNTDMLEQAMSRSSKPVESAVVEWRSMDSKLRGAATKKLEELGLDYEKV